MGDSPRQIGIILFDGVEELDAVGPWEVLAAWTTRHPGDDYEVLCLSPDGKPVTAAVGPSIGAHRGFQDAPRHEVPLFPGDQGRGACCPTTRVRTGSAPGGRRYHSSPVWAPAPWYWPPPASCGGGPPRRTGALLQNSRRWIRLSGLVRTIVLSTMATPSPRRKPRRDRYGPAPGRPAGGSGSSHRGAPVHPV